jgi:hypothetical protein
MLDGCWALAYNRFVELCEEMAMSKVYEVRGVRVDGEYLNGCWSKQGQWGGTANSSVRLN